MPPNGKKKLALQRLNQWDAAERRKSLLTLRLKGVSIRVAAEVLKVSPKTIQRDLEIIRKENFARTDGRDQNEIVGEALSNFQEIQESAWREYHSSDIPMHRGKMLDTLRTLQNDKIKAFKDVGVIRPLPVQQEVTHTHHLDWSEEMKEKVSRALIEQTLSPQLELPVPEEDVIDVTPLEDYEYEEAEIEEINE